MIDASRRPDEPARADGIQITTDSKPSLNLNKSCHRTISGLTTGIILFSGQQEEKGERKRQRI
jgi:hypothetical protein